MISIKKSIFIFLTMFMFYGCGGNVVYYKDEKNNLDYLDYNLIETAHFIFISKSIDISKLKSFANTAENIYYSIFLEFGGNYIFMRPYKIFVYLDLSEKNTYISDQKYAEIVFSTDSVCELSKVIASLMLKDVIGDYLDLYPILYYGYITYYERNSCLSKENYYSSLISDFISKGYDPFYLLDLSNPKNLKKEELDIYLAISSSLIKFLIERYSEFKFSIFINELRKGSSFTKAIENTYLLSNNEFKRNFKEYLMK